MQVREETLKLALEVGYVLPKAFGQLVIEKQGNRLSTDGPKLIDKTPTQEELYKWLREKHNLFIDQRRGAYEFCFTVTKMTMPSSWRTVHGTDYDIIYEFALLEALKLIKDETI